MSIQAYIILFVSILIFYVLIIWFLHKASVYFHKMDEKVGNTEKAEVISVYKDCVIVREDVSDNEKVLKAYFSLYKHHVQNVQKVCHHAFSPSSHLLLYILPLFPCLSSVQLQAPHFLLAWSRYHVYHN